MIYKQLKNKSDEKRIKVSTEMNEATKDFILLCIVGYLIWVLLVTLWFKFVKWWEMRFSKKHKRYCRKKYPHRTLTADEIIGKSRFNVQAEREQQLQRKEQEGQELAKKEKIRIKALASEMAKEMIQEFKAEMRLQQPPPEKSPEHYPKVIPEEELDAVFSNEEVLPDY